MSSREDFIFWEKVAKPLGLIVYGVDGDGARLGEVSCQAHQTTMVPKWFGQRLAAALSRPAGAQDAKG